MRNFNSKIRFIVVNVSEMIEDNAKNSVFNFQFSFKWLQSPLSRHRRRLGVSQLECKFLQVSEMGVTTFKGEICFVGIASLTFSYTSFIAEKLSISFKYTLTLTTFSHDEPAASKTFPRLLMHWAYGFESWFRCEIHSNDSYMFIQCVL